MLARSTALFMLLPIGEGGLIVQLHDLARPVKIRSPVLRQFMVDSLLIPAAWSFSDARSISIGGQIQGYEGIMIDTSSPEGYLMRVTAFCPKADEGKGELICLVRSSICYRCSRALLDSTRVEL